MPWDIYGYLGADAAICLWATEFWRLSRAGHTHGVYVCMLRYGDVYLSRHFASAYVCSQAKQRITPRRTEVGVSLQVGHRIPARFGPPISLD